VNLPAGFGLLIVAPMIYTSFSALLTQRYGFSPLLLALGWIGVTLALRPLGSYHSLLPAEGGWGLVLQLVAGFLGNGAVAFLVGYANASLLAVLGSIHLEVPRGARLAMSCTPEMYLSSEEFLLRRFTTYCDKCPRAPPKVDH
jgi:hypothetical protein